MSYLDWFFHLPEWQGSANQQQLLQMLLIISWVYTTVRMIFSPLEYAIILVPWYFFLDFLVSLLPGEPLNPGPLSTLTLELLVYSL